MDFGQQHILTPPHVSEVGFAVGYLNLVRTPLASFLQSKSLLTDNTLLVSYGFNLTCKTDS